MITRSFFAVCLLVAGSTTASQGFDRSTVNATLADACGKVRKAAADRCLVAAIPDTMARGSVSDHGPDYDAQGNPLDRHGNIVAVPAGWAGSREAREVFVSDPR